MFDFIYIYIRGFMHCFILQIRGYDFFFFSLFKVPQILRPVSNFMGFFFFGFCFCLSDPESNSVFMFSVVLM